MVHCAFRACLLYTVLLRAIRLHVAPDSQESVHRLLTPTGLQIVPQTPLEKRLRELVEPVSPRELPRLKLELSLYRLLHDFRLVLWNQVHNLLEQLLSGL